MINPSVASPYKLALKCYIAKVQGSWRVLAHRWYDVPYQVGWYTTWEEARDCAIAHVRAGGLSWVTSPKSPTPPDQPRPGGYSAAGAGADSAKATKTASRVLE